MTMPVPPPKPQKERNDTIVSRTIANRRTWFGPTGVLLSAVIGGAGGYMLVVISGEVFSLGMDWHRSAAGPTTIAAALLFIVVSFRCSREAERKRIDRENAPQAEPDHSEPPIAPPEPIDTGPSDPEPSSHEPINPDLERPDGTGRPPAERTVRQFDFWDALVFGFLIGAMAGSLVGVMVVRVFKHPPVYIRHYEDALPIITAGLAGLAGALATIRWKYRDTKNRMIAEARYCACGYPLRGLTSSVCPECGRACDHSGAQAGGNVGDDTGGAAVEPKPAQSASEPEPRNP